MILISALLVVAVVIWPLPRRPGFVPDHPANQPGSPSATQPGGPLADPDSASRAARALGPSTVEDVADAVVLLAVALRGGAAVTTALDRVADLVSGQVSDDLRTVAAAHRWGLPGAASWQLLDPCWRPVALVWEAAEQAGVAPAALLESAAGRIREHERARREARLQRAGVLLVLPLGGLFLPGFLATTVVPVVLHLLGETAG